MGICLIVFENGVGKEGTRIEKGDGLPLGSPSHRSPVHRLLRLRTSLDLRAQCPIRRPSPQFDEIRESPTRAEAAGPPSSGTKSDRCPPSFVDG